MTDYISRLALGIGKCNPDVFEDKGYAKGWNAAVDVVMNAPAADVRPVVLCKNCKYFYKDADGYTMCDNSEGYDHVTEDDFCSRGADMKEEQDGR